jgi:hypothetical protein
MPPQLSVQQQQAVSRISGLVINNAMIFQQILAEHNSDVLPLQTIVDRDDIIEEFSQHWLYIVENINYYPIFHLAREALLGLSPKPDVEKSLRELAQIARKVVRKRAALRHDLMGRIYHRLLSEAKYLGTYYTRISAAAMLLKLALHKANGGIDWHNLDAIGNLRIADLSCGTGTLLTAAADAVMDNYIRASTAQGQTVELDKLQKVLVEQVIYGYDVLPSATHLTASTLALRSPQITFGKMNLYSLPHGGTHYRLGSIEFLKGQSVQIPLDLFGAAPTVQQMAGDTVAQVPDAPLPQLDLCAINPPFTRSVGGNLLFGSVPESERRKMQKDLQALVRKEKVEASITAGLGSVFVALADRYIKPGGRLALVLPKALLSGVAWETTRNLISPRYRIEYLIVSHDTEHWNFSESTDLSEVLMVAVKHKNSNKDDNTDAGTTTAINLWHNPITSFEALAVADQVAQQPAPDITTGQGALSLKIGPDKVGEAVSMPWLAVKSNWILPCSFAQVDLLRTTYHLLSGRLILPGHKQTDAFPVCPLTDLGTLGFDIRDVLDGFVPVDTFTPYAAFWGHDKDAVQTIEQEPNKHLEPLPKAKPGRPLRQSSVLWPRAGKILLAERLRINSQRLFAVRLSDKVLSNTWWEFSFHHSIASEQAEKALALWLNSTLSLLLVLAHRAETEGAWMKFKKPTLGAMPVLDIRALEPDKIKALGQAYDAVSTQPMQSFPHIDTDPVRTSIDQRISQALGLPDISVLRKLLSKEPVVSMNRL